MSRQTVRAAVAAWFSPPAVQFLNSVYRAEPKVMQGQEFFSGSGQGSGAVAFVHIEREQERRIALGGATSGKKYISYDIALVLTFRSNKDRSEDAMDDYDTMVESLKERTRSDRQFGTEGSPNPIFQVGEGPGADIELMSDLPHLVGTSTEIQSALRLSVSEIITS